MKYSKNPGVNLLGHPKPIFILGKVQCWDFTFHVEMLPKGPREDLVGSLVHSTRSDELHPHFVVVGIDYELHSHWGRVGGGGGERIPLASNVII